MRSPVEPTTLSPPVSRSRFRPRRLLSPLSDERLVAELRRGNDAAFDVLYRRHHRGILSFCCYMLGSQEEGEDALQQTFLSAYTALVGDRESPARPKAWLYTIARNRCISVLRARRPPERLEADSAAPGPGVPLQVENRIGVEELVADLARLPAAQREALVLSELGDFAHGDVAQVIGCDQAKVKSLVFQARSMLIERRDARELPCRAIQEEVASLGRARMPRHVRRHVESCEACGTFASAVRKQRRLMALALPITPSVGLKRGIFASLGGGSGGGAAGAAGGAGAVGSGVAAAVAGGGAASGGLIAATVLTKLGASKAAAVGLAAASVSAGAGAAADGVSNLDHERSRPHAAHELRASQDRAPADQAQPTALAPPGDEAAQPPPAPRAPTTSPQDDRVIIASTRDDARASRSGEGADSGSGATDADGGTPTGAEQRPGDGASAGGEEPQEPAGEEPTEPATDPEAPEPSPDHPHEHAAEADERAGDRLTSSH